MTGLPARTGRLAHIGKRYLRFASSRATATPPVRARQRGDSAKHAPVMTVRARARKPALGFIFVTLVIDIVGIGIIIPILPRRVSNTG